ncbi:hypothetical protein WR25_13878 [Diploscapter pachys]|uniref:G-protein coupled receptors family 1 profile domain-containing protein n=1 Tax=Diploscapter pachys TaxID=2018661 RepID=A0A2A2L7F5_9BILA|nr:hypothetical protein WR25_13878 [Diploscapter pachys]
MLELEYGVNDTECLCQDLQTEDYSPLYAWTNYILIIIALPFLSVFGVFTNIINIFLYSRRRLRNSANTYLLFLACSDFLVILTGLFVFWIDSARSYIPELSRAPYTTVYVLPFGYMAQTCSIYFTVAAALECYINVCWHSLSKDYCTVARAKQICYTIVVVSIMYNSLRLPQFNLRKCFHETSGEQMIEICPTTLFSMINTVYNVYMYMVLMTLLPFFFLLCLNAIIVMRQNAAQGNGNLESNNSTNELLKSPMTVKPTVGNGDDTITMIMVVVLFLCCNTLALIVNVVERFFEPNAIFLNLITDASNFLVIFNSSVNCIIYYVFNRIYRDLFRLHASRVRNYIGDFCCCFRSAKKQYLPVSTENQHEKHEKLHNNTSRTSNNIPISMPDQYGKKF